jgi:hypothetical protein
LDTIARDGSHYAGNRNLDDLIPIAICNEEITRWVIRDGSRP